MVTKRTSLPRCNPKIFKNGTGLCIVDGEPNDVESWAQSVAKKAKAKIDWHYSGGRANVLHLGNADSYQRALNAVHELEGEFKGRILNVGGPALYRAGDVMPKGTIAVDPNLGPMVTRNHSKIS